MRITPKQLAIGAIVTIAAGFPLTALLMLLSAGSALQIAVAAAGLVAFYVPFYRETRAALDGAEPGGLTVSLVTLIVASYAPMAVLGFFWSVFPSMLGSVLLLRLRMPWGLVALAPVTAGQVGLAVLGYSGSSGSVFFGATYVGITVLVTSFVLYAAVRLVAVTRELERARAELAEAAVLRERLRISRDLHDGLGSSLTTIALKGDLARRLVERDPASARNELTELVQVARDTAQEVRQVARGYREMSLREEVRRGVALLEVSGIGCRANLADLGLDRPTDEALAWAVREGITNVLRHSRATTCSISTSAADGTARLELVNDGAPRRAADGGVPERVAGDGGGLTGLRERASGLGGSLHAEPTGNGGFRLVVEVPLVQDVPA
ncbi:hypothetical protein GCM10010156_24290 [Planobispora rosea]|uniref:Signal transduction histidine kinase subgroup 3 dimerisation and phosphoacceptor domain-containing protein n=1 Tax=Planobispora rosea TaxID=35762 RepID=A0A8J3S078_PLARO|nr:histidine kinase [Planobispora rosea]GGS64361.1 hypothetical protein GCM10010156_24290 [Planobispora rosea]GIH84593.1 hypothetical protein Pro02_30010 [Planobispora rosea]